MPQLTTLTSKSSMRSLALACSVAFLALPVHARLVCSTAGTPEVDFGAVDVWGAFPTAQQNMTITCTKDALEAGRETRLCLKIGDGAAAAALPTGGPNKYTPRLLAHSNGSDAAGFQIYQNAGRTTFWGSDSNPSYLTTPQVRQGVAFTSFTVPISLYMSMQPLTVAINGTTSLETLPAGVYRSSYAGVHTILKSAMRTVLLGIDSSCEPQGGGGEDTFPFTVKATVTEKCEFVGTIADLDFGTQSASATNLEGSTSIKLRCTRNTPYLLGVLPSNGNVNGAGVMLNGADQVPYQLHTTAGLPSSVWGNTGTQPSSPGNGLTGVGTGSKLIPSTHTIYATVASANAPAGTYEDTVRVTMFY